MPSFSVDYLENEIVHDIISDRPLTGLLIENHRLTPSFCSKDIRHIKLEFPNSLE